MKWIVLLLTLCCSVAFAQDPNEDPTEIYVNGDGVPAGNLNLDGGKKLILEGTSTDTFVYSSANNAINLVTNNNTRLKLSSTSVQVTASDLIIITAGKTIYHLAEALSLGSACTTSHSLVTGDVCFGAGAAVEFNDGAYFDSFIYMYGNNTVFDTKLMYFGSSNDSGIRYATNQTPDTLQFGLSTDSNHVIFGPIGSIATDNAFAQIPSPDTGIIVHTSKSAATHYRTKTESVTFSAGAGDASQVTTGSVIPAGAFVIGVSTRVTTTATTCTSVDIGIAAKDTDAFADGTAVAATTTTTTSDGNSAADYSATSLGIIPSIAAQEITVTAVGGNCVDGVWAITVHYMGVSAATSN